MLLEVGHGTSLQACYHPLPQPEEDFDQAVSIKYYNYLSVRVKAALINLMKR